MRLRVALTGLVVATFACAPGDQTAPAETDYTPSLAVTVGSVVITPSSDTIIGLGGSVQLSAVLKDRSGAVLAPGSAPVTWASLNPKRVSVTAGGKVTSLVSSGQARITATSGTRADTALIAILAPPTPSASASTISVAPSSIAQNSGSAIITVVVKDSTGKPVNNATVTLRASGSGNSITVPAATDSTGTTRATFTSTTTGTKSINASANGIALTQAATIAVRSPLEAVTTVMQCVIPAVPSAGTVNLATDLTYNTVGGVPLKLDIAWPRTAGSHPLVVVVHGGGWFKGDKSTFRNDIQLLAGQGYTAVAVNYRLVSGSSNAFPAAAQDLRCALRWLRTRATTYHLDPDRGAAVGVSAGGHLADLLGLAATAALDGPCGSTASMATIKAVAAYAGPSDLRQSSLFTTLSLPLVTDFLGGTPESVPVVAKRASPLNYPGAGDPPILLIHGTADPVVPPTHSSRLKSALNQLGLPATYVPLQGLGHDLKLFSTASASLPGSCTTLAFLAQELQP
jgi:acetyl esterase/lipase